VTLCTGTLSLKAGDYYPLLSFSLIKIVTRFIPSFGNSLGFVSWQGK